MDGSAYMARVKQLPCVLCWHKLGVKTLGVDVHHVGVTERSDWLVIPLCVEHHRGATGLHGLHRRAFESFWKTSELTMLGWTNKEMNKCSK